MSRCFYKLKFLQSPHQEVLRGEPWLRWWLLVTGGFVLLYGLAVSFNTYAAKRIKKAGRREKPKPSDVAIVLGAYTNGYQPGTALTSRLKAALELYRRGYVRYLIVSGGQGTDETVSEARSMKRFLIFNGVPAGVILEDRYSTDTWENLRNSREVMSHHGLESAIIVTSDYHLPRSLAVARQLNMKISGYAARSGRTERRSTRREVLALIKYLAAGQASWRKD